MADKCHDHFYPLKGTISLFAQSLAVGIGFLSLRLPLYRDLEFQCNVNLRRKYFHKIGSSFYPIFAAGKTCLTLGGVASLD